MTETNKPAETEVEALGTESEVSATAHVEAAGASVESAAAPEVPLDIVLPRILARGELLARRLPALPDSLWEEGGSHFLQVESSNDDLDWLHDGTTSDDGGFFGDLTAEPVVDTGPFPWWLRPLWGLGVAAMIVAVWWRLPDKDVSPISGTPAPRAKPRSTPSQPTQLRHRLIVKRKVPYPRLFPAHRLRPKGLPLTAPVTRRSAASQPVAKTPVSFHWFMRRGAQTRKGHDGMLLQADDELRFAYSGVSQAADGAHIMVLMVDAKGQVSPIYPAGKGVTMRLQRQRDGRRLLWLPDGAVLDDSVLRERIFVCVSRAPRAVATVRAAIKQALQGSRIERLKRLPIGCLVQKSWLIHKQAKGQ